VSENVEDDIGEAYRRIAVIDDMLRRGTLTRHKCNGRTLVLRSEVEALVEGES
jgi:hypothetical protein